MPCSKLRVGKALAAELHDIRLSGGYYFFHLPDIGKSADAGDGCFYMLLISEAYLTLQPSSRNMVGCLRMLAASIS
jgi:hypothetical protein